MSRSSQRPAARQEANHALAALPSTTSVQRFWLVATAVLLAVEVGFLAVMAIWH